MWFSYFVTIVALLAYAEAYSSGAPELECQDMLPFHKYEPRENPAPYVISTSTKVIKSGKPMEVTISGKTPTDTIRGIMLQARYGDKIVGIFTVDPNDPFARIMKCDVNGDTVTNKNAGVMLDKTNVTFTWTAPAKFNKNIKKIKFRATIIHNYDVFWVGVESAPIIIKK